MKAVFKFISVVVLGACAAHASARDSVEDFLIADAMSSSDAKNILGEHIKFYFGDQAHPKVVKDITTSSYLRKTNGANKTDKDACNWAFLSAMKELKEKAQSMGGNAVVNIRSNYSNNETSSPETYKCASGLLMSSVALVGDVVVIE